MAGLFGRAGLVVLGVSCFGLAAITPLEIRYLARGLSPIVSKTLVEHALKSPWVLQPTYAGFSILSPSWLYVVMPILFAAVTRRRHRGLAAVATSRSAGCPRGTPRPRACRARRATPRSASRTRSATCSRTSSAPGARTALLETVADNTRGRGRVEYTTSVVEPVETYLYRPLRIGALTLARLAKRLQSGRLEAYVAYMLFALVVALAITAAMR